MKRAIHPGAAMWLVVTGEKDVHSIQTGHAQSLSENLTHFACTIMADLIELHLNFMCS